MKLVHLLMIAGALGAQPVFAQSGDATTEGSSQLVSLINSVVHFISSLITWVLPIVGAIVVMMVIIGGLQITAGQKDVGKKTVTAALTGAALVAVSYAIVEFMKTFF